MKPILVTGGNRTGTTWVGKMLSLAEETFFVWEPFNQEYPLPILGHPLKHHYRMILPEETGRVRRFIKAKAFSELICSVKGGHTLKKKAAKLHGLFTAVFNYSSGKTAPLFKDPIALMSAEWMETEFQAQVVVMVRHPGAYVNSIKRLDWATNMEEFAQQPQLMATLPESLQKEIHRRIASRKKPTGYVLEEAALCWKVFYQVVNQYSKKHPDWILVRHEDLSLNYHEEFKKLYASLGLTWTGSIQEKIEQSCSPRNKIVQGEICHASRQNSAAVTRVWKTALSKAEQTTVRRITEPVSQYFYDNSSWE